MNINDSAVSEDGPLKVTLTAFDPARGKGQIRIEELVEKRGWFYVTVKFAAGGQNRVDYKTWDVHCPATPPTVMPNDPRVSITP